MQSNEGQQQYKFKQNLSDFLSASGLADKQAPEFNQFQLYKLVCRRGGCQSVSNRREWGRIAEELKAKDAQRVKRYYLKYLHNYERKYYFGQEDEEEELLVYCNPRKMAKVDPANAPKEPAKIRDENLSLETEIAKNMEDDIKEKDSFYLNKNKLNQSKAENKRIILGLESFLDRKSAIYSLNMLLLYSVNASFAFLFENNEKIFNAVSSYAQSLYPPDNEEQREHLRTIVAIFRNLTMNPVNLKYILSTPIFQLFVKMFNTRLDSQCSKNIVDVMTGLVKVGWDCNEILNQVLEAVLEDRSEDVESSLELLRGLMDERDENMIINVRNRVDVLLKVLLSCDMSTEIKELTLEILSFVSDVNAEARVLFAKNSQLLSMLINILQHMRHQEKLTQFAALTLSNISTAPGARYQLSFFQSELMLIGFTDDSLAGIMANILADVANA